MHQLAYSGRLSGADFTARFGEMVSEHADQAEEAGKGRPGSMEGDMCFRNGQLSHLIGQ